MREAIGQRPKFLFNLTVVLSVILAMVSASFSSLSGAAAGQPGKSQDSSADSSQKVYIPLVSTRHVSTTAENPWSMAGGNPERTSWTPEEVRGKLKPDWYMPIEPYILPRVQIIAAYGTLYLSTSRGLYAVDASSGAQKWIYPTELPLGHSPTVLNGMVYVGGFDHKIYALDAFTGKLAWTFEASKGFDTNPLVVNGLLYAGNRDGYFYAVYTEGSQAGQLAWKYKTGGPIHFSAAYKDGVVFFASDDSYAYALNAENGKLFWKSDKLPGAGFHSWWPVVYKDWVIFAGSNNYRFAIDPGSEFIHNLEEQDIYPNHEIDPKGTLPGPLGKAPGDWAEGTPTIDTSQPNTTSNGSTTAITKYFEKKPWRRTYFVLDRKTGKEYTTDFDHNGIPEYAPILWFGTKGAANRYPPVVGSDGILYQANNFRSDSAISGGQVTGWQIGTPYISIINSSWNAVDEPIAYAAGGNLIYWSRVCDRVDGAVDISIPEPDVPVDLSKPGSNRAAILSADRSWNYFGYNLPDLIPGYNVMYSPSDPYSNYPRSVYGGHNGYYGCPGDWSPPIPYQGKVYALHSNALVAFAPQAGTPTELPIARTVAVENADVPVPGDQELKSQLEAEVQKILDAGHLRPGYMSSGIFDLASNRVCGDALVDYFHSTADTIVTLIEALPYLPSDLQTQTKAYLQNEFDNYPPYAYDHIGWREGAPREVYDLPPEVSGDVASFGPQKSVNNFTGWNLNPYTFYALWKYAEVFGDAKGIFDTSKNRLDSVPPDDILLQMPFVHNAYIAGYRGYLELEKMAGYPESADVKSELDRLLKLRVDSFSKDAPDIFFQDKKFYYCRNLNAARNFMYMTPELGKYLHDNINAKVQAAIDEYNSVMPYWFVAKAEVAHGEGVTNTAVEYWAVFQARALILEQPRQELAKYLDVPAFAVGDLYYIQNLIATLESPGNAGVSSSRIPYGKEAVSVASCRP